MSRIPNPNRDVVPSPHAYYLLSAGIAIREMWARVKREVHYEKCRRDGIGHIHQTRFLYDQPANVVKIFCDYCGAPMGETGLEDSEHAQQILAYLEQRENADE